MNFYNILKSSMPKGYSWILKFDSHQPRDSSGKWTKGGAMGALSPIQLRVAAPLTDKYDKNTTTQDILNRFDSRTRAFIAHAEAEVLHQKQLGNETDRLYAGPVHGYTAERYALHEQIVKDMLAAKGIPGAPVGGFKKSDNPTAIILGGRGGSGKSQFDKVNNPLMGIYDSKKTLVIDPDKIKEELGKHGSVSYSGANAALFHMESGHVADMLIRAAKRRKLDIVLDITMKNDKSDTVRAFKKSGYTVDGHYMFLPAQYAAERAVQRFMTKKQDGSGRYVPVDIILANKENEKHFDKLIPMFHNWSVYSNDVKLGDPPKRVAGKGD